MRALLLFSDRSYQADRPLPPGADALEHDLGVGSLLDAMSGGDAFDRGVARQVLLDPLPDEAAIRRRLDALEDCRAHPEAIRELRAIAESALSREREFWGIGNYPDSLLFRGVRALEGYAACLERLRAVADRAGDQFRSEAFARFFASLRSELDDAYLAEVRAHLERLELRDGTWISLGLGSENRPAGQVLRRPLEERRPWWRRLAGPRSSALDFEIAEQDESGGQALARQREKGIASVARAVARSNEHLHGFFTTLRAELAFYLAGLRLEAALAGRGFSVARPEPAAPEPLAWDAEGLYDPGLALRAPGPMVANDLRSDGRRLVVITGANQGGKSTFLRAIGLAQLLLQAGLSVPARRFRSSVAPGIASHFPREEDATMQRGRLDDELRRMEETVGHLRRGSLLLSNESFSSTNEREGSAIGADVFRACTDSGVRVVAVTHLFELARILREGDPSDRLFLRAERASDGRRTYRILVGDTLPTSFGADVFQGVFETPLAGEPPPGSTGVADAAGSP